MSQYSQFWKNKIAVTIAKIIRTRKNDPTMNSLMKINAPEQVGPQIELGSGYSRVLDVKKIWIAHKTPPIGK